MSDATNNFPVEVAVASADSATPQPLPIESAGQAGCTESSSDRTVSGAPTTNNVQTSQAVARPNATVSAEAKRDREARRQAILAELAALESISPSRSAPPTPTAPAVASVPGVNRGSVVEKTRTPDERMGTSDVGEVRGVAGGAQSGAARATGDEGLVHPLNAPTASASATRKSAGGRRVHYDHARRVDSTTAQRVGSVGRAGFARGPSVAKGKTVANNNPDMGDADAGSVVSQDTGDEEEDELWEMTVSDARIEGQFISRMLGSYVGLGGRTGPRLSDEDWSVAAELIGAWLAIEGHLGFAVHGRDVPEHTIDSLYHWAGRRERPAVLDEPEGIEEDYGDRVAHFWLAIREQPAGDVKEMVGQNGLSTFIQAVMQWRPVEPDTDDWEVVLQDAAMGFRALLSAQDAELTDPLGLLISRVDRRKSAYALTVLEDRASSVTGPSGWMPARVATPRRKKTGTLDQTVPRDRNSHPMRTEGIAGTSISSNEKKRRREDSGAPFRYTRPRKSKRM
ncbi:hypothetical protein PENSPDRAFT_747879 [Peniophora sp. CONT]|nr:hypothetical protein PENSPDRAFT_747879 [Peniophora sp. CONT]